MAKLSKATNKPAKKGGIAPTPRVSAQSKSSGKNGKAVVTARAGKASRAELAVAGKSKVKSSKTKASPTKSKSRTAVAKVVATSRLKAVTKKASKNLTAKKLSKPSVAKPSAASRVSANAKATAKSRVAKISAASSSKTTKPVKAVAKAKTIKQAIAKKTSKPTASKSASRVGFAKNDYSDFKRILLDKRRRLFGDVAGLSEEALGSEDAAIVSQAPIHPAEVGSHSFEQEFTLGLLSRDGDKIRNIDWALEKLAEGTYGQCDECGGRIPKARLEMLPESIYCVKCASKLEGILF